MGSENINNIQFVYDTILLAGRADETKVIIISRDDPMNLNIAMHSRKSRYSIKCLGTCSNSKDDQDEKIKVRI